MALPQGINFRATSGYVTDPTGTTNEVSKVVNYPRTTPQGNNVGWETLTGTLDTRNRNSGVDARIAGTEFLSTGSGNSAVYRIDLPSAGSYNVRAAFGDIGFSVRVGAILQDGSTDVATLIVDDSSTGGAGNFYDATGVLRTGESDWVANNAALTQSFSTSILRVRIPGSSFTKSVAHFYVEDAGGGAIELTASNNYQTDTSATGAINQSHALTAAASSQTDNSSNGVITQIHVISAENSSQTDTSTTTAITQQHILIAATSTQTDTAATVQISQAHELTVAGSAQTDTSGTGTIGIGGISLDASSCDQTDTSGIGLLTQTHALISAASTETDTSSNGALTQIHVLSVANSVQTDASSTGAITSAGDLVAANCSQTDTSATGTITQTHSFTAENSTQTDISGTGAIDVGSVINLTAANSAQTDFCQTAIITQTHLLIIAPSVQDDVASSSSIVQLHLLLAASSTQTDTSSSATIINPLDSVEIPRERIIAAMRDNRIIYIDQWGRYGH